MEGSTMPIVRPVKLDSTLYGLHLRSETVQLAKPPSATRLTARISNVGADGIKIWISHVTVFRVEHREVVVDTTPDELPPGHEGPITITVDELVPVGQSNGAKPVAVDLEQIVQFEIVAQPLSLAVSHVSATLEIIGEGWEPISVPLRYVRICEATATYAPDTLNTFQAGAAISTVTVASMSGPADEIEFQLVRNAESEHITMEVNPRILHLGPGEVKTVSLTFRVGRDCPVGKRSVSLSVSSDSLPSKMVEINIAPARPPMWDEAVAAINAKAVVLQEGPPGPRVPTSEVQTAGTGFFQAFSTGNIYWHKDFGAKWVYGAILMKYRQIGGPLSSLGFPRTDEQDTLDRRGRMNEFKNGPIYFSSRTGAQAVQGKILERYRKLGAEVSYLGYPTHDQRSRETYFQTGNIRMLNEEVAVDVTETREVKTGVIHVDGAAANGWAELTLNSLGGLRFKGSMRSTGTLSYDVLMSMSIDLQSAGGPVIVLAEKGNVEGSLILGGHKEHTWDFLGTDDRIKTHWPLIRNARVHTDFTVEFGLGDVVQLVASILGVPVFIIAMIAAGQIASAGKKYCGRYHSTERYNPDTGTFERTIGEVWVDKDEFCPPGLDP